MKRNLIGAFTLACCLTACSYQAQIDKATQQAAGQRSVRASAAAADAQNSAKQAARGVPASPGGSRRRVELGDPRQQCDRTARTSA